MRRYLVIIAVLGFLICSVSGISLAQEEEETAYSWGTVKSISSKQIVVTEYDYDKDEEIDMVYTVDPNMKLFNVNSLEDIAVGSKVWIDYVIREGKKAAVGIEIKEASYIGTEEDLPSQTYEQEPEEFSGEEEIEY